MKPALDALRGPAVHAWRDIRGGVAGMLRSRRRGARAALLDDLAMLLETGVTLVDAVSLVRSSHAGSRSREHLLLSLQARVREGDAFSDAIASHAGWFDPADVAAARAGEHAGTLAEVLRNLAARHARGEDVNRRITAALAYPVIVLLVGVGVVLYLSRVTLPKLAAILTQSNVAVPGLTLWLIRVGDVMRRDWPLLLAGGAAACALIAGLIRALRTRAIHAPHSLRRLVPGAYRRATLAPLLRDLAAMLGCGVPLVESLRVLAPSAGGMIGWSLRTALASAADRVEQGDDLSHALDDPHWFPPTVRHAVSVGESSGELRQMLDRLADAEARRARGLADRLLGLIEPAAIITLAALIGVIVLAAILPLVKLQEIVR